MQAAQWRQGPYTPHPQGHHATASPDSQARYAKNGTRRLLRDNDERVMDNRARSWSGLKQPSGNNYSRADYLS
ncbi:hypothetical protein N7470_004593 [Penicillium chermesinum]|nr:hypothetical protein N7470_004593 [Penicillium chermesinum]